ncbi:hypothetical protein Tco_0549090 [Tanacetum coccineum]
MFYTSSYTKGWMSFVKRSNAAPVCHSKPLDSVKNWNDHFFWVDLTAFPFSVSLKSKILSKDPPPKVSQYDTEARNFLRTHIAPFRKFPEPFLCWVEMDLFAFIRHFDPTKVRIGKRDLAKREVKLLKMTEGRTILLDLPGTAASGGSGDNIDKLFDEGDDAGQEHSANKKQKRKLTGDASGSTHPPKKLRDDYQSVHPNTSGKSLAALCGLVSDGSSIPSGVMEPLIAASVAPTLDFGPTDSVSRLNLSLVADASVVTVAITTTVVADVASIPGLKARVESKNLENVRDSTSAGGANADAASISKLNKPSTSLDSFYASQSLDTETMHRVYVLRWKVTNDSILEDLYVCHDLTDRLASPALFAQLRVIDYDQLYS